MATASIALSERWADPRSPDAAPRWLLPLVVVAHVSLLAWLATRDLIPQPAPLATLMVRVIAPAVPAAADIPPARPIPVERKPVPRPQPTLPPPIPAAQAQPPIPAAAQVAQKAPDPSALPHVASSQDDAAPSRAEPHRGGLPTQLPTVTSSQDDAQPPQAGPHRGGLPAQLPHAASSQDDVAPPRFDADYLHNPAPVYPALSRRLGEEGRVVLRVFVEPSGRPSRIEIGTGSGSPRLDRAALEAVRHWQFVPARRGDMAVGAWVLVPIVFDLRG